jgi:phage gpG-like protein
MEKQVDIWGDKELVVYLNKMSAAMKPEILLGLAEIGSHLVEETKKKFGSYQHGWPKLKRSSVIAKWNKRARLNGFKSANFSRLIGMFNQGFGDDPLVLSGKLRDSIQHELNIEQLESVIYSDVEYAAVHEYGHGNVPARSYLRLTLWDNEDYVNRVLNSRIEKLL